MVLGPFAETKGPRLPGRNPATIEKIKWTPSFRSSLRLYSWMSQHAKASFAKVFPSFTPWANEAISFLSIKPVKDPLSGCECLSAIYHGAVEKSRQRRSRHFSVLTYWKYALRAKMAVALLDELF